MENLRGQDLNLRPPAYEAGELPSALPRNMRRRSGAVSRSRDLRFKDSNRQPWVKGRQSSRIERRRTVESRNSCQAVTPGGRE